MIRAQDALELLLPDADALEVGRARSVTHFLRLLSDDAQPARARTVGVDLERARSELERANRADLERALCDLVRHHLRAVQIADSFAWFGEPELDLCTAWRTVGEFSQDNEWLASVPEPGESPESVVERLLASLERTGFPARKLALWRARAAHSVNGARAAEPVYRAELRAALAEGSSPNVIRACVAGVAECLLDRGAVRDARGWLYEHLALAGGDPRLRQLLAWSRLCLGDAAGAKTVLLGLRPWPSTLPAGLVDLRACKPEWLPCLAGRAPDARAAVRAPSSPVRDRHDLGAVVLALFVFRPGKGARPIHVEVAPGLRAGLDAWLAEREDAGAATREREHRLVAGARVIVEHADGAGALRSALGREATRALALAPVLDDDGEVAGWLHTECEHHLLPSAARLTELARAWRVEVLVERDRPPAAPLPERTRPVEDTRFDTTACAAAITDLLAALGIKTHQRLWWGFHVDAGRIELVAQGGEGVGFAPETAGKRRGLQRALASAGPVHFDEPDERLALRADAGSGFVLPLAVEGRICGLFALESSRRRDFKTKDVEGAAAIAERHALALRLAQFRAWHGLHFGFEPWFDALRPDFRTFATSLILGARSRSPLVISGPPGTGKLVLARWFHFESSQREGPFKVLSGQAAPRTGLARALDSAAGGSLVLDDVEDLPSEIQEELLRRLEGIERAIDDGEPGLEGGETGPDLRHRSADKDRRTLGAAQRGSKVAGAAPRARVLCTSRLGLGPARESGRLRADLAARLDRLALHVPALRERREEIPTLARHMALRFAQEEEMRAPRFEDDALALLWRQSWPGNLRDLENVVYKLVLLHPGRSVSADDVRELRRLFGVDLIKRVPSRRPDRRDLVSALRTTQKAGGRANKTRAALYLGWDPDTLVARMQSEKVPESGLDGECAWKSADAPETLPEAEADSA